MELRLLKILIFALGLSLAGPFPFAFAGLEKISQKEFQDLAQELSGKVNLFREGWKNNPDAEFYGGTTRDYLYWLKGQFREADSREEALAVAAKLKALPEIDVRDFLIGDSDADIISATPGSLDASEFGVRKIDFQSPDILNPHSEIGRNEHLQGYIPAEKIRLGRDGFHASGLGDGLKEIYEGKLSVHFSSAADFAKSKYARDGINHPILLALRYLRLHGANYFRTYGTGFPDAKALHAGIDDASAKQVRAVIEQAVRTGELAPYLEKPQFLSWINGAIQKSFRSYTNPTAALELMKEFGADQLPVRYPEKIEPLNQYVFTKYRDKAAIEKSLADHKVNAKEFYQSPAKYFSDGKLYHGTKTEGAFRAILFQGALPSTGLATAGNGLYGVAEAEKEFSEKWAGDKKRLLSFDVNPKAKLVDITQGEGKRLWEFMEGKGIAADALFVGDLDSFADRFGIDIIRYPYQTKAFVVKNAAAVGKPAGVYRSILPISELLKNAAKITTIEGIEDLIAMNSLNNKEIDAIWRASAVSPAEIVNTLISEMNAGGQDKILRLLAVPHWQEQAPVQQLMQKWLTFNSADPHCFLTDRTLGSSKNKSPAYINFLDGLFLDEPVLRNHGIAPQLVKSISAAGISTPNATAFALKELTKESKPPLVAGFSLVEYIGNATLSAKEEESVWKLYLQKQKTSAAAKTAPLARALLRNGKSPADLLPSITRVLAGKISDRNRFDYLELLVKYSPQDPFTIQQVLAFMRAELETATHTDFYLGPEWLSELGAAYKDNPEYKRMFLDNLSNADAKIARTAAAALADTNLSRPELLEFLDKAISYAPIKKVLALPHSTSPELSRAITKLYLRAAATPAMEPAVETLLAKIRGAAHQESIEAYLIERLRAKVPAAMAKAHAVEVELILGLVTSEAVAPTAALQSSALQYLEKKRVHLNPSDKAVYEFLNSLPLEDAAVAERVQNHIVESGRKFDEAQLIALAQRLNCGQAFALLGGKP